MSQAVPVGYKLIWASLVYNNFEKQFAIIMHVSYDLKFYSRLCTHSIYLYLYVYLCISNDWEIPWTEEPGRLQSIGLQRLGYDWATSLSLFTFMHWRRQWQPTPVFLPGESQGWEPGGLPYMGSHRVGHDWCDLAAV